MNEWHDMVVHFHFSDLPERPSSSDLFEKSTAGSDWEESAGEEVPETKEENVISGLPDNASNYGKIRKIP